MPLHEIFGGKFLSSLWACCLDCQFVRPRLIELAGSDVILPDIVVPQAVRVLPKARSPRLTPHRRVSIVISVARRYWNIRGA